jgi:hypothetical protein
MFYFKTKYEVSYDKLQQALLTNPGCESEFAKLNNRVEVSGRMTTIATYLRKNINATNVFFSSELLSVSEKHFKSKRTRNFEKVKTIKRLEADFLATVKAAKQLHVSVIIRRTTELLELVKCMMDQLY